MPFIDAMEIINEITNWIFLTNVSPGLDLLGLILFVLCIGWVIHSLANKEA